MDKKKNNISTLGKARLVTCYSSNESSVTVYTGGYEAGSVGGITT